MAARYVFSLNGEDYAGNFATRQAAEAAAFAAAGRKSDPPGTVYVGRAIAADPGACGQGRAVMARMSGRLQHDGSRFLKNVTTAQIDELDAALETTILAWLCKQRLMPTRFHVEAISEHPVHGAVQSRYSEGADEVHDLGVSETAEAAL